MKIHALSALSLAALVAACAPGAPAGEGPMASMPDVECSVQPLEATPFANRAQQAINRTVVSSEEQRVPLYREALEHAEAGVADDDQNPYHLLLAGWAAAGLTELETARDYFDRALVLCPELEEYYIGPAVTEAWVSVFIRGLQSLQEGDTASAVRDWEAVVGFWDGLANAHFNLGVIHSQRGNADRAVEHYAEALRIFEASPLYDDEEVRPEGLETRANAINGMIVMGVHHFQQDNFARAAEIFQQVLDYEPNARDAAYNLALSYFRQQRWQQLEPIARQVAEIDPLNFNAHVVLFNAYRGQADAAGAAGQRQQQRDFQARANAVLQDAERLQVRVDDINVITDDGLARITGVAVGTDQRGGPVTLDFTVYGAAGRLGSGSTTFERPPAGEAIAFQLEFPVGEPVSGWRYTVR